MKTIGLIGGMSWRSSLEYYRIINETVHERRGGWHSAKILMYSADFDEIDIEHQTADWQKSDQILIDAVKTLEQGGAEVVGLCANTAHALYDMLQQNISVPILHIADAVAEQIKQAGIVTVGLLGTRHTMQADFYKQRLETKHGLKVMTPEEKRQELVHQGINNVCQNKESAQTKADFIAAIEELRKKEAAGIILGCTELSLIVRPEDLDIPLFDTTRAHAEALAEFALE